MMDSQENALLQGAQEEQNVEQTAQAADAQKVENAKVYKNKKEVVERLKEIAASDENPDKDEIDLLKTVFYKLHIAEREARLKEYIDGGGDPATYQILPDEDEETFKAEMAIVREKRQRVFQEQEAEKLDNLAKKLEIIDKIKAMATSPDEANKSYNEFKELQQQWKDIKAVPADKASELWRNYQLYVEQFYDLLKLNSEAREYDFKKNLELKTKLCEAAENLANEEDVISAFHQLQELHQQYREIGPVAKELREHYPQAIEARKAALRIWQNASLKLAQADVASTDVQLQEATEALKTETNRLRRNLLTVKRDSLQARYEAMCGVVRMIHLRQKQH